MPKYLISYDLTAPSSDYNSLIDALREHRARHPQDSVWIWETNDSLWDVLKFLELYINVDVDRVLIYPLPEGGKEYNNLKS